MKLNLPSGNVVESVSLDFYRTDSWDGARHGGDERFYIEGVNLNTNQTATIYRSPETVDFLNSYGTNVPNSRARFLILPTRTIAVGVMKLYG